MEKSEEPELKPCPFCGSVADFRMERKDEFQIECTGCGVRGAKYVYSYAAIRDWNRRAKGE